MDTKITPKTYAPGEQFITTVDVDHSYRVAKMQGTESGTNEIINLGLVPYGTRHEAAVQAQIWAKNIHLPYEGAGTDV